MLATASRPRMAIGKAPQLRYFFKTVAVQQFINVMYIVYLRISNNSL
jgi:hypothetical protein